MDSFSIPPTIFIAFGVISAALLAGFFSFLNLVSTKENKVSEFRLSWIDGLREEIASYTAAVQDLVRSAENYSELNRSLYSYQEMIKIDQDYITDTRDSYIEAIENLSKIQLRLNPEHINDSQSHEANLMTHINNARNCFNNENYTGASDCCIDIRNAAAPLLKNTWNLVKGGEDEYKKTRATAQKIIKYGIAALLVCAFLLGSASLIASNTKADRSSDTSQSYQQPQGKAAHKDAESFFQLDPGNLLPFSKKPHLAHEET